MSVFIFLMSVVVLINSYSFNIIANDSSPPNEDKISDELQLAISTAADDEMIPMYVWLDLIDLSLVEIQLEHKYGIKSKDFTDQEGFEKKIVSEMREIETTANILSYRKNSNDANYIRELYSIDEIMTDAEIYRCLDEGMELIEIAAIGKQQEYVKKWRSSVADIQSTHNDSFIQLLDNSDVEYSLLSIQDHSSLIIIETKKQYISFIADVEIVNRLDHYVDVPAENALYTSASSNQERLNITLAQNTYFSGSYGSGIKIGVIEYVEPGYDTVGLNPQYSMISGSIGTRIFRITNSEISGDNYISGNYDSHGAYITSIIAGDATTVSGLTYRGVAPQATVYYTQF